MSKTDTTSPFRGPSRSSHLRNVSTGSPKNADTMPPPGAQTGRPQSRVNPINGATTQVKPAVERICTLWVHDDRFSREEVVLNFSIFPKDTIRDGDLVEMVAFSPRKSKNHRNSRDTGPRSKGEHVPDGQPSGPSAERKRSPSNALDLEEASNKPHHTKSYVFIAKDMSFEQKAKKPNLQISLAGHIASAFGFRNKTSIKVSIVDKAMKSASHVEISFRDQYLARSDMWRLAISELTDKTVYKGQKILFLGTIKALVKNIFVRGQRVQSAFFSANTKPIFRSESARYVLFIQMSKEMWDFDSEGTGQIMFNKVVNGFLPDLFKRWTRMNARHLVSIILFTRVEYEKGTELGDFPNPDTTEGGSSIQPENAPGPGRKPYKDFFRVVITEMASGEWTTILYQLKKEFTVFLRDILVQPTPFSSELKHGSGTQEDSAEKARPETVIAGYPSAAIHGNMLEAINLASSQFSQDYIDRDLIRTGISVVVITPGTGYFEVDYQMLKLTTETLVGNGIGIDLVCLSKMPLHSVPLFKYRTPHSASSPNTLDNSRDASFGGSPPRMTYSKYGSFSSRTNMSPSKITEFAPSPRSSSNTMHKIEEWSYAVPHWIDVSFWSSTMSELTQCPSHDRRRDSVIIRQRRYDRKTFIPRCRMYELQMMGIMENEISNIAIPYLHDNPFYQAHSQTANLQKSASSSNVMNSRNALSSKTVPASRKNMTSTETTSSGLSTPTGPKKLPSAKGLTSALAKADREASHRESREAYKWMDEYDEWVFRPLHEVEAAIKEIKDKQAREREEQEKSTQRLKDEGPFVYGTSFSDQARSPGGMNAPPGTAYFDRKMKERRPSIESPLERKFSTASFSTTASVSIKPPKVKRQISFGLRGFGIGTPKSTASTELRTEHAKPGPILTRGFQTSSILSGTLKDSPQLSPFSKGGSTPPSKASTPRNGLASVAESGTQNDDNEKTPSRPIAIKTAMASLEQTQHHGRSKSYVGSVFDATTKDRRESEKIGALSVASITKQAGPKIDIAATAPTVPPTLSPTSALAPWMTVLNPSNPRQSNEEFGSHFKRWQHVFPRPLRTSSMKWKSLCSPAAVPLTTELFPTAEQLATEYHESPYSISQNDDDELDENPKTREDLMRELIALRLSQGFQLVVGPAVATAMGKSSLKMVDVFDKGFMAHDGAMVFMSMGNTIHQLLCVEKGQDVEIKRFVRKPTTVSASSSPGGASPPVRYKPRIRPLLGKGYYNREINFQAPLLEYNWNYVDSYIAGYEETLSENLRFWRARFLLIPVDPPSHARRPLHSLNEDNEEEIRLEGIRKLTQIWQRNRYIPPEERQYQSISQSKKKDLNPLDLIYKTRDPSQVIAAELDALALLDSDPNPRRSQLFAESELFSRNNINMVALAQAIQGERGVRMQDRRWHWRLHYNCFIGFELTTWLWENFKDVESREEAVELGNELMKNGLFQHVERRHKFRDGNFFYQISSEFRTARPESRGGGWFTSKRTADKSVPSTPMTELPRDSSRCDHSRSSSNGDSSPTESGAATPRTVSGKKLKVALSRMLRYDVDPRKKSYRPELVNLHYDRLHNPDNCYHIRIDWMNVTAKLIEDAIFSWANLAERYGLKLVEAPLAEASSITTTHPFRAPAKVRLAIPPPSKQPETYFDTSSFSPHQQPDRQFYQKALMRKFNFVLDTEAASNFSTNVDVVYSWGKPDYRYSQYIHRTGVILAQITDEGDFILLANRLYNSRTGAKDQGRIDKHDTHHDRYSGGGWGFTTIGYTNHGGGARTAGSDEHSSYSTPIVRATPHEIIGIGSTYATPQRILLEFETFCSNAKALEQFYEDASTKLISPGPMSGIPMLGVNTVGLGMPHHLTRGESPSPIHGLSGSGSGSGSGSTAGLLLRDSNTSTGNSHSSPRGSTGDGSVE